MRLELKRIHQQYGITTVYVTHDQVEAMTMADRIALMSKGELQQYGPPDTIYRNPGNIFVAGFIGAPKINLVPAQLVQDGGSPHLRFLSVDTPAVLDELRRLDGFTRHRRSASGRSRTCRPLGPAPAAASRAWWRSSNPSAPRPTSPCGWRTSLLMCRFPARTDAAAGSSIEIEVDIAHLQLFDDTGALADLAAKTAA